MARHWLDFYGGSLYDWHKLDDKSKTLFYRRQGIVENLFDSDGVDFEGRADLNINPDIEIRTTLDGQALRDRILLVWAVMRNRHVLLSATSRFGEDFLPTASNKTWPERYFVYEVPPSMTALLAAAQQTIAFLQPGDIPSDHDDFYLHLMNTGRPLNPSTHLAKLFVYPPVQTSRGTLKFKCVLVASHHVADGLTVYRWTADFVRLLNLSAQNLDEVIGQICSADSIRQRLPPCQEALYPPLATNEAGVRWKWVMARILRHVYRAPPVCFQNPLRRDVPLNAASDLPPVYPQLLDYSRKPPLNCYTISASLSRRATHNMVKLCRQAGISIGSGSFTLAGLVMMRMEELRNPGVPYWERLPFVGSFPINPRPFLSGTSTVGQEDSLMLAFSDGVTLPFVPSDFDLRKSFRVLGRLAHRQLKQYQKRKRTLQEEVEMGSRSPFYLLPNLYLATLERLDSKVKPEQRIGFNPQGLYPARRGGSLATCGISSVGDRTALISEGMANVDEMNGQDLVADFRDLRNAVRARDGEFLIGAAGTRDSQSFGVSYDGSAIDPEKAKIWKRLTESLLDVDMDHDILPSQLSPAATKL